MINFHPLDSGGSQVPLLTIS